MYPIETTEDKKRKAAGLSTAETPNVGTPMGSQLASQIPTGGNINPPPAPIKDTPNRFVGGLRSFMNELGDGYRYEGARSVVSGAADDVTADWKKGNYGAALGHAARGLAALPVGLYQDQARPFVAVGGAVGSGLLNAGHTFLTGDSTPIVGDGAPAKTIDPSAPNAPTPITPRKPDAQPAAAAAPSPGKVQAAAPNPGAGARQRRLHQL